jgi:O-antigen/teichoic acid export membrane protein
MFFMGHSTFTNGLIMVIALGEIFKAFEVVNYLFQSQVKSKTVVQLQIVINIVLALVKVGLVFIHAPLIWFAVVVPIGTALNAVGYVKSYRDTHGSPWKWFYKKDLAITLLRESWPLALYGIALNIQARIDQVMLGKLMTNYEVGQYSVALKMIEIFGFVPMVLMNTFTPAVTRAKAEGEELYRDRLVNLYRLMFFAFLLTAIPLYLFAEEIIVLLYGFEYQAAGYLLSLFALRLFFSNMGVGKSVFIVNESLFKYSLLTVIIGAFSNIGLNYFLIPAYGMEGAIVASMVSFTISIFIVDLFFASTRMNQRLMFKGIFSFWKMTGAR